VQLQLKKTVGPVGEQVGRQAVGARAGAGDPGILPQPGGECGRVSGQEELGIVDEITEMPGSGGVVSHVSQEVRTSPLPVPSSLRRAGYAVA
jgi:hypothetical protein